MASLLNIMTSMGVVTLMTGPPWPDNAGHRLWGRLHSGRRLLLRMKHLRGAVHIQSY